MKIIRVPSFFLFFFYSLHKGKVSRCGLNQCDPGVSDAGTRLLSKFRSGTHGLNEKLSRHRGKNGRTECV